MSHPVRATLLRDLQAQIARIETSGRNPERGGAVSSGFAALDRLLPQGGLTGGTMIEWLGADSGNGGLTLALAVAGRVVRATGGVLTVIGGSETLFAPAAAALGAPLERTILVRPHDRGTALWAWEQSLRCEAVGVTLGRLEQANDTTMRRLQLAVEAGGGLGFLVRSAERRAETAWSEVRLLVKALPQGAVGGTAERWRLRVEALRRRGGFGGAATEVEVGDEANDVRLVSELASATRAG